MPDMDFDSDAMLAFFGQMGKGVDELKTKIVSLNEASLAMKKMTDETERFGQTIQRHTRSTLRGMEGAVTNLTRIVGGAGGLALTLVGAAKTLDNFAVGELRLRNFATNTGFTTGAIRNLRVQLSAAGLSADEAAQGIGSVGAKLQEVLALQETSPFYRALQASEPQMAEYVRHLVNAGKQQEALNYLQEKFNNGGERFKIYLSGISGQSKAAWEAQRTGMQGLIPAWEFNEEAARQYHRTMVNLETIFTGVWTSMTYTVLEGLVKLTGSDGLEDLNKKAKAFADNFKKFFDDSVMPTLRTTFAEAKAIIAWFEEHGKTRDWEQGGRLRPEEFIRRQNEDEQKKDFNIFEWLGSYIVSPAAAAEDEGKGELLRQEVDTDKDSDRMLRDMRDIIQRWDDEVEGVGAGGAEGGAGGAATFAERFSGTGGDGNTGSTAATGGPVGLNDEGGKKIDAETMREAERLGRAGDTAGVQRLFTQRGYRMTGPACGRVAAGYVKSAGFKPPTGSAIATTWHKWGVSSTGEEINSADRPFGSMVATYWHGRYQGKQGQILRPGETGGHVMTPVTGTYDSKTNTAVFADQYGAKRRSLNDMDVRYAGDEAVAALRAQRGEQRDKIDKGNGKSPWDSPSASVNVTIKNAPPGVKTNAEADGAFKTLNLSRSNQLVYN